MTTTQIYTYIVTPCKVCGVVSKVRKRGKDGRAERCNACKTLGYEARSNPYTKTGAYKHIEEVEE